MNKSESIASLAAGYKSKIVPFATQYVAVENGTVISLIKKPKILKPISIGQYVGLQLRHDAGYTKKEYLHRIIARTFLGEPIEGEECAHIDGNRLNCRLDNLQWVTRSVNHSHKRIHGTSAAGEANPMHKLTANVVMEMRKMRNSGALYREIAENFGVATMTAHRAITGKCWGHV